MYFLCLFGPMVLQAALQAGLSSLSQADVGSALQVLFNLGQLKEAIAAR